MKNRRKIFYFFVLCVPYFVAAQQVIIKDTINETPLTIMMDAKMSSALQEMEEKCKTTLPLESVKNKPKVEVVEKNRSTADICRDNPRILGYKIQVALVKSNDEANRVKAYFRLKFPNIKAETDASLRPNYKVLVGSYFSKQSASGDLARIRSIFPSALPIQYRVFCVEAK